MSGQRGDVGFLAGTFTGRTFSRRCTVPQGVPLFFPIVNTVQVNTPFICGQDGPLSVAEMRANTAASIDGASGVTATLDSAPLLNLNEEGPRGAGTKFNNRRHEREGGTADGHRFE